MSAISSLASGLLHAVLPTSLVTNNTTAGTLTNYLDIGAATNKPSRYYRARLVP